MRRLLLLCWAWFLPMTAVAQDGSIDDVINNAVQPLTDAISWLLFYPIPIFGQSVPFIVVWLVVGATFFTLYFGFINVRGFAQGFRLIRGDYSDPKSPGEVTHFQALATAVSGTVGLGNIAGVAVAVTLGGPGATFWMILAGLLGMSTKFCECTLGVKYRNEYPDGTVSGGPMYYLSKGLTERSPGLAPLGKVLAVVFAIFCIGGSFGGGNMFQANQAHAMVVSVTGGADSFLADKGWLFGLAMAVLVAVVIIGGIKSIARVTGKLVPFMATLYIIAALFIIISNIEAVPAAFALIVTSAFNPVAVTGGVAGVLIQGFRRAAFSNEAGTGSAAIAHSAVKTNEPVTEGLVALWEPFIDTVVICTMTALVLVISGMWRVDAYVTQDVASVYAEPSATAAVVSTVERDAELRLLQTSDDGEWREVWQDGAINWIKLDNVEVVEGVTKTNIAFGETLGWFPYVLALAVVLFAFSTMLAWSYYGMKCWTYLLGEGFGKEISYKLLFCAFVVIGSSMNLSAVTDFSDAMILTMAFPNIIGLYLLGGVVKRELKSYLERVKSGEIQRYR
ncbi:MAG: alanine/glycine:cation symporter family protein [Xanthomonadales bacterium]|nr:alanine/glycine:cation symporter family protein [Xanthomonadales bacterium]